jgi:LEA14-like dessication related protein
MKNIFLFAAYCLLGCGLFSCAELKPVTIGGIENPVLNKISREGIEAEFSMKIKNPNNKNVTVYPSTFEGMLNDISVGKIQMDKKVKVKANSNEIETFHIKSDFSKQGLADIQKLIPIIASGSARINLKGNVRAGKWYYKRKFPVEFSKIIPLSK